MFLKGRKYLPVMCYLDENLMDIGGNIYPEYGFISAKKYTNDIDIRYGLYGIPWGRTNRLLHEKIENGYWTVVKTEINGEIIKTDYVNNRVKFRNGIVLAIGSVDSIGEFIYKNRDKERQSFSRIGKRIKKQEIVGTKKWMKQYYRNN